ncbi:MAG TPA: CoA pyrophosphatase [Candidatus Desulfaltia sp.]|nr:CoA pyrophosphatase [Candidatus Desulfaltia sp.]
MPLEETRDRLKILEQRLRGPKPGLVSQLKMVPGHRHEDKTYQEVGDSCHKAGVLVLLYPWNDRLHIVLTRRTSSVAHHQAQISFPGGHQDSHESVLETALREAEEEIGVSPLSVRILGELTPLYVPPSNYCIYPVVAAAESRPDFHPSPHEVAEVLEVPLDHLYDTRNVQREVWRLRDLDVRVPFYIFRGHKVWGATAMIMAELLDLIK